MHLQPQAQNFVWVGWQSAIATLGMSELKVLVKKAFDRGFIDSYVLGFEDFEQDLRRVLACAEEPWCADDQEYTLFGDTVEEFSDGIALASNTGGTGSEGGRSQRLLTPAAFLARTRSEASGETTLVRAAAARNSKNAA